MKRVMDIDWKTEFEKCEDNVKEMWRVFNRKMREAEKFIPKRTVKFNNNSSSNKNKYKRPLDRKSLCRIKRKSRLWEKYCQTNDGHVYLEYRKVSNQVRRITRKAQKVLEKNVAKQAMTNPKNFWQFVNNKTRARPNIPDLFVDEGTPTGSNVTTSSDKEKANISNQYFASVFTKEDALYDKVIPDRTECKLNDIDINEDMVKKKLLKLKVLQSKGPDGIHPRVLKELASVICIPLAIIFKTSIRSGTLPDEWKLANVTAIHKNGHRQIAGNYRPVSLTSVVCKVLESIVREQVINHMKSNKLFSNKQFEFIGGRSTTLQLLRVIDEWTGILDNGGSIDMIYFDFMKAFDKVSHSRLILKLKSCGIGGVLLDWLKAFLTDRNRGLEWMTNTPNGLKFPAGSLRAQFWDLYYL